MVQHFRPWQLCSQFWHQAQICANKVSSTWSGRHEAQRHRTCFMLPKVEDPGLRWLPCPYWNQRGDTRGGPLSRVSRHDTKHIFSAPDPLYEQGIPWLKAKRLHPSHDVDHAADVCKLTCTPDPLLQMIQLCNPDIIVQLFHALSAASLFGRRWDITTQPRRTNAFQIAI